MFTVPELPAPGSLPIPLSGQRRWRKLDRGAGGELPIPATGGIVPTAGRSKASTPGRADHRCPL
jgi:hypothetical protein